MTIEIEELKAALKEIDPVLIADLVAQPGKTLADSDGIY